MKKVLIIGDSSATPREELPFDKTYYARLKRNKDLDIENSAVANNTSYKILNKLEAFMLYGFSPDVVVLNYGIVDVYPRPYSNVIHKILTNLKLISAVDWVLKKTRLYYKLGDLFNFKEVSEIKFKRYSEQLVRNLVEKGVDQIVVCGIIKPDKVLLKSKNIIKEVMVYNQILQDLSTQNEKVDYIDMFDVADESFTIWDGYHYSVKASEHLAKKIEDLITDD